MEQLEKLENTNATLTIYACGGAGTNVGTFVDQVDDSSSRIFSKIEVVYVDTSNSDVGKHVSADNFYRIGTKTEGDAIDGSGQVRKENAEEILRHVPKILLAHPPGDYSLVISSGGGGTGSVAAPSILSTLIKEGKIAAGILIGSRETLRRATNTLDTLRSYYGISRVTGRPAVVYFEENNETTPREKVDERVRGFVAMLRVLFSGKNHGLDSKDLYNWVNYDKVTSFKPTLARLELIKKDMGLDENRNYASLATLVTKPGDSFVTGAALEYQCSGVVSGETSPRILEALPLHFAVMEDGFTQIIRDYEKSVEEITRRQQARTDNSELFKLGDDEFSSNGLVI